MKSSDQIPQKIAIIDYGMGNVKSVANALEFLGCCWIITRDEKEISSANGLILPGVGAFGAAMENLSALALIPTLNREVIEKKKPVLGICLGMQLMAQKSFELGTHNGLGWIEGEVREIDSRGGSLQVPHVGWNQSEFKPGRPSFTGIESGSHFYFDHSYHLVCPPALQSSIVSYGQELTSSVESGNVWGAQFHPEKSQRVGLKFIRNFVNAIRGARGEPC